LESVGVFVVKGHERIIYVFVKFSHSIIFWLSLDNDHDFCEFFFQLWSFHIIF